MENCYISETASLDQELRWMESIDPGADPETYAEATRYAADWRTYARERFTPCEGEQECPF